MIRTAWHAKSLTRGAILGALTTGGIAYLLNIGHFGAGDDGAEAAAADPLYAIGDGFGSALLAAALIVAISVFVFRMLARRMLRLQLEVERLRQERKRAETQVTCDTDGLRRRLLWNVAHELRTPLATVSAHLESLALDDDLSTEERRRYIRIAFAAARRLTELLDESRPFEELNVSRAAYAPEPFQLVELAHDVAEKANGATSLRGVAFRIEHPHNVSLIVGDIRLLERVFDVLLEVAAQHAAPQGEVLVRLFPRGDAMRVEVRGSRSESARSIAPGLERVCCRPASSCSSSDFAPDLAMLRKILEMHGQTIDFAQARDGVRFLFDLSLAPVERRLPSLFRSVTSVGAASL